MCAVLRVKINFSETNYGSENGKDLLKSAHRRLANVRAHAHMYTRTDTKLFCVVKRAKRDFYVDEVILDFRKKNETNWQFFFFFSDDVVATFRSREKKSEL